MYSEPEWSNPISKTGSLETLKNGIIIENLSVPIGTKFLTFGRLPSNSVILDHESISREHAVLQFGPGNTAFIYDMNSTHGTFVNKKRIPSKQYVKITSGNGIIQFGASSRSYILILGEMAIEETIPSNGAKTDFRQIVNNFFSAHDIPLKAIEYIPCGNSFSCYIDYSEYVSIDSSDSLKITSSGITREEALENFYEDSFNILSRLELIERPSNRDEYESNSDSEFSDSEFKNSHPKRHSRPIVSSEALSEEEVLLLRNQSKKKVESIEMDLEHLESKLKALEKEIVEDFDVFVQDLKKEEIKADIEKRRKELEFSSKELSKYETILNLIGYKEKPEQIKVTLIEPATEGHVETIPESHTETIPESPEKIIKKPKVQAKYSAPQIDTDANNEIEEEGISTFEDSTLHDEQMDLTSIKRKYGY